jgi:hypothetical protein
VGIATRFSKPLPIRGETAVGSTSFHQKFARLFNYASNSGGDISYARKSQTLERLYSQITEQARHEYTVAYVPRGNNRTSEFHVVEVRTTREGLHVKTRQGYYTGTAPSTPEK